MENNYNLSSVILVNTQMYVQKTGEREQWREAMRMLITIYLPLRHATWYGLSVSNMDLDRFWDDTAVSRCDTDLRQITEKTIYEYV